MLDCPECYNDPEWQYWKDQPMNEEIRKRLDPVQQPKQFYPSFMAAAKEWGNHITEGLNNDDN